MALLVLLIVAAAVASQPDGDACAGIPGCAQANATAEELAKKQEELLMQSQEIGKMVTAVRDQEALQHTLQLTPSQRGRAFSALASLMQTAVTGVSLMQTAAENERAIATANASEHDFSEESAAEKERSIATANATEHDFSEESASSDSTRRRKYCEMWPITFERYMKDYYNGRNDYWAKLIGATTGRNEDTRRLYFGQKYALYSRCLWGFFHGLYWARMKIDMRNELYRLGQFFNTKQSDIQNELGSFLMQTKIAYKKMTNTLTQQINEQVIEMEQNAEYMFDLMETFEESVHETNEKVISNNMNMNAFKRDSKLNKVLLEKRMNTTVEPLRAVLKGKMDALTKNMNNFITLRKQMHEEASEVRDKESNIAKTEAFTIQKDERTALALEKGREEARSDQLKGLWSGTQTSMGMFVTRAGEMYDKISLRAEDQKRRVNTRGVDRMKAFGKLTSSLDEIAKQALDAVEQSRESEENLVKNQYMDSFTAESSGIGGIENDIDRLWRRYSKGLKESYQEIDKEGGRVASKQIHVSKSLAEANGVLLAIQQEYREEAVALDSFVNNTLGQLQLDASNANDTNKLAVDANITRAIELDAGRQLRQVADDARKRVTTMATQVKMKGTEIQERAHDLTGTVETEVDDASIAVNALKRNDLNAVQDILNNMEHRLQGAYDTRYADDDELITKVHAQDDKLYKTLNNIQDESFDALDAVTAKHGDLKSLEDDTKNAVNNMKRGAHDANDELEMYQRFFAQDVAVHQKRLDRQQVAFAKDAYKRTYQADKAAGETATVINDLLPAVKDLATTKATAEMEKIHDVEDHLRDETKRVVVAAAEAQVDSEQNMVVDSSTFGDGFAKSLRGEVQGHDSVLAALHQDVVSESDELQSRHHEAETASKQAAEQVKLVQDSVEEKMRGVSEQLQATHATAKKVVHQDSKAQLEAQEKALQGIKTKLFSDQSSAQQKLQMDQKSNFQKLSKLEQEAAQDTLVMNKDAKENVTDVQGQFVGKLSAARSAFKALMAHIHGLAANTSEWRDMVEDAVKGERAAAHRQALVESNTRLEQQSMLDTRYRELASTVQMKVDGLQNSTQDEMMAYMDESKKAAQKILKSVSMSNDEKLKALEKVDKWLVDQLHDVQNVAQHAENEATSHGTASADFAEQASRKAKDLQRAIDADKSIHQVFADQDLSSDGMSLEELIRDADAKATSIASTTQAHVGNFASSHESDAIRLKQRCATDLRVALEAMASAVSLKAAAGKALAASEHKRGHALGAEEARLQQLVESTEGVSTNIAARLGTQAAEREKRYDFLKDWTVAFQTTSAESIEELTRIMYQLVQNDKVYFEQHSEKIADFASHLADALNSDEVKTLSKIGNVDLGVDSMITEDNNLLNETEKYDRATARYRQKVATSLDHLTGGLTGELAKLSTRAKEFDYGLKKDADSWQSKSEDELRDVLKGQEKAVQTEQHRMQHQLDNLRTEFATNMKDDQAAEDETVANAEQEAKEQLSDDEHLHTEFANLMGSVTEGGVVEEYARTLTQLLHVKQTELDEARARLDVRMSGMSKLVALGAQDEHSASPPSSTLQSHSGDQHVHEVAPRGGASERQRRARERLEHGRKQEEEGENARLVEEHAKLVEKAKRLAIEVRRIQA
jgi:hypothetical protein